MCVKAAILAVVPVLIVFIGCDPDNEGIIDPSLAVPFIVSADLTPEEINTDTILVHGEARPDDTLQLMWSVEAEIDGRNSPAFTVRFKVHEERSASPLNEGVLGEIKGENPGIVTIAGRPAAVIPRSTVGTLTITVFAETSDGLLSNQKKKSVTVFRANRPPVITRVEAPDTIDTSQIQNEMRVVMTAFVDDPDGVDDVIRVETINRQPDGVTVGPFELTKNEPGVFSIEFTITPDAKKGTHRFEFRAFDRMNEPSDVYIHEIVIQ